MRELLHDAPAPAPKVGPAEKYPFKAMKVGDSFIADSAEVDKVKHAAYRWRERHMPWAFIVAQDDTGQWRLWRTKGKGKRRGNLRNTSVT